ncbi:MAG: class D sortase [Anaerolineales bacterium]|nr:class D sortase [Anaerolineales bacterium]
MAGKIYPEDLSESELQELIKEKRRKSRQMRIEEFRRQGRVIDIVSENKQQQEKAGTELIPSDEERTFRKRTRRKQAWTDRILLGIEIMAIAGLLFVFLNGIGLIQQLNEQVAAALVQSTLTPTPLVSAIILPSGHTSPNDPGGARFNEAEIPEHLRPLVQSLSSIAIPTPSPEQAVRIQIPALGVDAPVVQGDGWEELKKGVGQHIGSVNPGANGNLVLSAHNDIFGEIFRHLDQLQPGDEITVYSNIRAYTYVVTNTQIVDPLYVQVMDNTPDATVTLISCFPYLVNDQRIVVKGVLQ